MTQTILGKDELSFRTQLKNRTYFAIALAVVILACNVVCVFLSSENNYKIFLWANIATDIAAGIFLVWYVSSKIVSERKSLRLFGRERETFCGEVQIVSEETLRYADFDCLTAQISDRIFYIVANGFIVLKTGETYTIQTVSGIIVSAIETSAREEKRQNDLTLQKAQAAESTKTQVSTAADSTKAVSDDE